MKKLAKVTEYNARNVAGRWQMSKSINVLSYIFIIRQDLTCAHDFNTHTYTHTHREIDILVVLAYLPEKLEYALAEELQTEEVCRHHQRRRSRRRRRRDRFEIEDNRQRPVPIVKTVILCGRIGIAYTGRRDD